MIILKKFKINPSKIRKISNKIQVNHIKFLSQILINFKIKKINLIKTINKDINLTIKLKVVMKFQVFYNKLKLINKIKKLEI